MLGIAKRSLTGLVAATALFWCSNSVAGLFDFLSGGDKKAEEKQEKPQAKAKDGAADKCSNELVKTKAMSAAELMTELRGLKSGFVGANPVQSLNSLFFGPQAAKPQPTKTAATAAPQKKPAKPAPNGKPAENDECQAVLSSASLAALGGLGGGGGGSPFSGLVSSAGDVLLDALISELSYSAIEAFLGQMLERPDVMSKISVDVPDVSNLTPELRKQTLNLGGYLAAIKGANLMVESAQKDFDEAKTSYKKVMELREKAAVVLLEALTNMEQLKQALAVDGKTKTGNVTAEQVEFISKLAATDRDAFFKDLAVQRIALEYMKTQPDRKGELVAMADAQAAFKSHYQAYGRTAVGAGSMVGFSSLFLKKAKHLLEKQGPAGGAVLVPMLTQGATEVGTLAMNVKKVFDASDEMNEGTFFVEKVGEGAKRGISFQKALTRMDDAAVATFKDDLIRDDKKGHLTVLYLRAKDSATGLADRVTGKDEKRKVAEAFGMDEAEMFSFQNALRYKLGEKKQKKIDDIFLFPVKGDGDDVQIVAMETAQSKLREGLGKFTNGDVRRMIFAKSSADQAITIGGYRIGIDNLGMEGLNDHMDFMIQESRHTVFSTIEKGDKAGKAKRRAG